MSAFIPPYPPRLQGTPTTLQRLWRLRDDMLGLWEEAAFEYDFVSTQILSRRIFLCNSPESVQFAFSTNNASFEQKSPEMRRVLEPLLGDGLFISGGETWRTRRRIVAPVIHISRLAQFAPMMVEVAVEARDRWAALPRPGAIDALSEMAQLTAEIICRTIFGRELGHNHAREIVEAFTDYQRVAFRLDYAMLFGLPDWLPRWPRPALRRSVKRMFRVIELIVDEHRRAGAAQGDSAIGLLLRARDEDTGQPLDAEALRNEAVVLFMAGHETTANTLAWTWFILSQTPDVEARLHAELDTVLGGRLPTLADVPKLVYTRAIIDEVLRLYPPVPFLSREAGVDEEFQGQRIPKGSVIIVAPWLLHRHKKLWEQPDHFIPERFLPGGSGAPSKFAYVPFSIGPRICAGMAFGQTESILCLAILAQSFRLRLKPGTDVQPICRMTLRPGDELPMTAEPRAVAAARLCRAQRKRSRFQPVRSAMHHEAMPLRWFFPPPVGARTPLQQFGRDAIGLASLLGHTAMRPLPIDAASLIGQELWSRVGHLRFPEVSAHMAGMWRRLRPSESAPAIVDAVVEGMWRNIGRVIGEYSVLERLWPSGRIAIEGSEQLSAARDSGRPVIVMGLHLGNWEVIPPAIVGLGHPMTVIYQRPADRLDHHLIIKARRRYDAGLLPPDPGSARAALRLLQDRSRVLLIYADEWVGGRVNAPAFGRPPRLAGNIANVARLAAMTNAIVIPAYALRTEGAHFRLTFQPPVALTQSGARDADLADNVAQLDAVIAPIVRAHLDQWLMLFDFRADD